MALEVYGNVENPRVIVIGVFHGDEPQGDFLIRKYLEKKIDSNLLMVPCLNKTGLEAKTRVNANGVDLNRNFPTKNWVLSDRGDYFGGEQSASESETKDLIELIEKYNPKAVITLHAPYKIVNYDGDGANLAKQISKITGYPVEKNIGYPTPGSFGTWAGIEKNIPVITLELDEEVDVKELLKPIFRMFEMLETY